ncbi:MAG: hypothetical protein EBQ99_02630 [Planctomycetes bacterium]|nr:hypothetical protein [Planctomycetota bacterium]
METKLREALEELRKLWGSPATPAEARPGILERLDQLSMLIAYQGFDLEATRRENDILRRTLRDRRSRRG